METPSKQKKGACKHYMAVGDLHELCRTCRTCSHNDRCSVCSEWSAEDWIQLVDNPRARSDKRKERTDPKTSGKSLSSNQGEFFGTQGDPIVGDASEKSPIVVDISDRHVGSASHYGGKEVRSFPADKPSHDEANWTGDAYTGKTGPSSHHVRTASQYQAPGPARTDGAVQPETATDPVAGITAAVPNMDKLVSVSYTHLTLPTILRV